MQSYDNFTDQLEIFFGDASDALCHLYARLRGVDSRQGLQLIGKLIGPECLYAQTLPATFAFADRGPGPSLLAETIVTEPCFWTPEMPHLYQAEVQLWQSGRMLASVQRPVGMRRLGAHRGKLIHETKSWVMRGVHATKLLANDLSAWHDSDVVMIVRNPDEALCREASRIGVLLAAELDEADTPTIARLSRWPAVGVVSLPSPATVDLGGLAHNLLLAQRIESRQPLQLQPWAQLALCEAGSPDDSFFDKLKTSSVPLVAVRPADNLASVVQGRAACDRLQRDLAGQGELAGYIV